jgi:hypothetical protein
MSIFSSRDGLSGLQHNIHFLIVWFNIHQDNNGNKKLPISHAELMVQMAKDGHPISMRLVILYLEHASIGQLKQACSSG